MPHLSSIIVGFFCTVFLIKILSPIALSIQLIDKPDKRKQHKGTIPLIGGIAIILGFSFGCLLSPVSLSEWRSLFLCLIPLIIVGVLDDHGDLSVKKRVAAHILTVLIMIFYAKIKVHQLGDLVGTGTQIELNGADTILTILFLLGIINSLNLIDGIDGLCASVCMVALGGLLLIIKLNSANVSIAIISYFFVCLFAFLISNLALLKRYIPKVFLGDAGTTVIGFFLCWNLLKMSQGVAYNGYVSSYYPSNPKQRLPL
jgi:UDP-GlcNAc:undecaprenyl-phosphate/decaprenyl-phosphate GlcNAc-1-phosphate transferase